MSLWNDWQARRAFASAKKAGLTDMIKAAAEAAKMPVPIMDAIAWRETRYLNRLGDFRKGTGYHGVGLVQIDIQHAIARTARDAGTWKTNPYPLIAFGANLMAANFAYAAKHLPALSAEQLWKITCDGYNEGIEPAVERVIDGRGADSGTTGGDYGQDCWRAWTLFGKVRASEKG